MKEHIKHKNKNSKTSIVLNSALWWTGESCRCAAAVVAVCKVPGTVAAATAYMAAI